jgi:hypothetical protein
MSGASEQTNRGDMETPYLMESWLGDNGVQQGAEYGNIAIPANQTPISVSDVNTALGVSANTNRLFWRTGIRLTNHSGYRNPSTGVYEPARTSTLGDCRGKSIYGWRLDRVASYDYELSTSNTGVGVGLYAQTVDEIQLVFCSTDTPTYQIGMNSSLGGATNWQKVVSSTTNSYGTQRPACSVYLLAGANANGTAHPLYISFGTGTGFTLHVVKLRLYYPGASGKGIHEYVVDYGYTAYQHPGQTTPPTSTITSPGTTWGVDWAWCALYFASTMTTAATPSSISYTLTPTGSTINRILQNGGNAPIARSIAISQDSSINTIPTISNLAALGQSTATWCDAGFYLGAR